MFWSLSGCKSGLSRANGHARTLLSSPRANPKLPKERDDLIPSTIACKHLPHDILISSRALQPLTKDGVWAQGGKFHREDENDARRPRDYPQREATS